MRFVVRVAAFLAMLLIGAALGIHPTLAEVVLVALAGTIADVAVELYADHEKSKP